MKRLLQALGGFVLTILGFGEMATGCLPLRCEYGCPHADFRAEINVVDEQGKPLQGIRTVLRYRNEAGYDVPYYQSDTLYTSNMGLALFDGTVFSAPAYVDIVYEDLSGEYMSADTYGLQPEQVGEGDKHWYSGSYVLYYTKELKKK